MENRVAWSLFTQEKSPNENDINLLQDGQKFEVIHHFYGAKAIFLLFCDHQDTKFV